MVFLRYLSVMNMTSKELGAAKSQSSAVPKYRGSITLRAEIAALLETGNIGTRGLILHD
jgi:hypothetical protein